VDSNESPNKTWAVYKYNIYNGANSILTQLIQLGFLLQWPGRTRILNDAL